MSIRELRESAGFTQKTLADKLQVDRSTVAKWECGENFPRSQQLILLAEILNTDVITLLEGNHESAGTVCKTGNAGD